ncbi:GTP 3',8-cyclase MoaA [Anaerosphaera multitolerans]|uniref:GTP 3',8-cyclase n=1 Tax=Anaerosphaera multitolerans TaxID=2487351 RepID=A0A437S5D6_9FIRM|nr:GTP 3',8-cyclase MoaA [Anaerosphaera multitolerans]RVU54126.1 GTP 3',8-cyclase MoaA [Anaerosphaera multitolerans]
MFDLYNRKIDYIRVSLTERCNLRCVYCMTEKGIEKICHEDLLSYEDLYKLLKTLSKAGIRKIKITGGEPFVRKDAIDFIKLLKQDSSFEKVTVTTNGLLLDKYLDSLIEMGIDGINISLDSLREDKFKRLTRGGNLKLLIETIDEILNRGYENLKLNTVLMKGVNDDEILDFARFVEERNMAIRFIELMPIGEGRAFKPVKREEIMEVISKEFGKPFEIRGSFGNGPAKYVSFQDFNGKIGFIDAVNHKFCSECNRIRVDSKGFIRFCLQYEIGMDTKEYLKGNISEAEFLKKLNLKIVEKPLENNFLIEDVDSLSMNQIGG